MMRKQQWLASLVTIIFLLVIALVIQQNPSSETVPPLINSSFEPDETGNALMGWASTGMVEADGHSGGMRLTHPGGPAPVETSQTLTNMPNGWYTLKAWVRSSGKQQAAYIALKDCGGPEQRAAVPIVRADRWLQIVVSARVTHRQCTVSLVSEAEAGEWVSFDELELVPGRAMLSIMGADISSLIKSEDNGGLYAEADGTPDDALVILRRHGLNYARLRVWVNSPDGYHGQAQLLVMAQRLKAQNIKLLVDFHYSDSWADPGKQNKPAAWEEYDFEQLKQAVYDHTFEICNGLKAQGTPPDMVQIGNEINSGMLWPDGHTKNWDNLAALLKEGYRATKDCSPATQVMVHIAEGGDNDLARWWFDNAIEREVPYDLIGLSYYPFWHGTLVDLQNNLNDVALRYNKDIVIVETAYPFTPNDNDSLQNIIRFQTTRGYPATPEGQVRMMEDILTIVRAVPNGRGLGIFYWDATWTAVPGNGWDPAISISGNGWENQALFDFDNRALPAMDLFNHP